MKRYKLQPCRKKSRKIGRNEPCPCGRTKQDGYEMLPVKWKHCCGDPDNQRMMRAVQQHISSFIRQMFVSKKKKKSKLSKLAGFFRREKQ